MATYIIQRVLQMIPVMVLASIISFAIIFLLPGDPALLILGDQLASDRALYEAKRQELGLDRPVPVQYLDWLGRTLQGDLGTSTRDRQPVTQGLRERLPITLQLAGFAMALALVISLPAGIISALKPNSKWDIASSLVAFGGIAIPNFWFGILLIYLFAVELRWLPSFGRGETVKIGWWSTGLLTVSGLKSLVMPVLTLGFFQLTLIMRLVRSQMLETLRAEYVRFARARGLPENVIRFRHALKNTMIPVITIAGLQLGSVIAFAIVTETVFQWPGLGALFVNAVQFADVPVMATYLMFVALVFVVTNLVVDLCYFILDPRIRVAARTKAA